MIGRRKFLGFLGGAAVAGPGVAKAAAEKALTPADLRLEGLAFDGSPQAPAAALAGMDQRAGWITRLRGLVGRRSDQHRFWRRRTGVWNLDPDLASYRSFSLSAKMRIQQDRNYERELEQQKGWLEAKIEGLIGADD